jgi:hypothetical protein
VDPEGAEVAVAALLPLLEHPAAVTNARDRMPTIEKAPTLRGLMKYCDKITPPFAVNVLYDLSNA